MQASRSAILLLVLGPDGPSTQYLRFLVAETSKAIWFLEPETTSIGYLDPLGGWMPCQRSLSSQPNLYRRRRSSQLAKRESPMAGKVLSSMVNSMGLQFGLALVLRIMGICKDSR